MPKQTVKTIEQVISELYGVWERSVLVSVVEQGFIYGPYGTDEHYLPSEISAKISEYEATLTPVVEPAVE